jgi:hypothetical protein
MNPARRNTLMLRWSVVTAGAIALFWGVWYLVNGSVPVVTSIPLTPKINWNLPFGISRWWDVLLGPLYSVILIDLFSDIMGRFSNKIERENLTLGVVLGLIAGVAFGLVLGLGCAGLVIGLGFELSLSLAATLYTVDLAHGLLVGLIVGVAFGLVLGLGCAGLVVGLIALVALVKFLVTGPIGNRLMAR